MKSLLVRSAKMKILLKIISALLYFNCVSPVLMYYIHDENPNVGYIAAVSGSGPYKNRVNSHKKYFIGSNNQKNMKLVNERAVDSHFTVLKSPPKALGFSDNERAFIRTYDVHKYKENNKPIIKDEAKYDGRGTTNSEADMTNHEREKTTTTNDQPLPSSNVVNNFHQHQHVRNEDRNGERVYDKKLNFVEVNANKAQISKDEKLVNLKNNNQLNPRQAQLYHQRLSGSSIKDKILHKASKTSDRNSQLLQRNEPVQRKHEPDLQKVQKVDSRKRETLERQTVIVDNNIKSNSISETMRKYIHKDMNKYKDRNNAVPSRIGIHEEIVDVNETPYALFYKMNPEHHMNEELDVMIGNTVEDPATNGYNGKVTWNYENQVESTKKLKRAPNVKISKMVKNYTSYKNG